MTRAHLLPYLGAALLAGSLLAFPWTGCKQSGVGDPCIPEQEYQTTFSGFTPTEVATESESFQCETRLCFVNHFQGRVSCPYGQLADGGPPAPGGQPCYVPNSVPYGSTEEVPAADLIQPTNAQLPGMTVAPQCNSRRAADTVFCSCRCANVDDKTDDGDIYCKCPSGFACSGFVSSIGEDAGVSDVQLTGYYCAKSNVAAYGGTDCTSGDLCDATNPKCQEGNQWQQPNPSTPEQL